MAGLVEAGAIRQAQGDGAGAAACYRAALAADPEQAGAWQNLSVMAIDRGQKQAAIVMAQRALALRPDIRTYCNLGGILLRCGYYDDAIDALGRALAIDETDWGANHNLGLVLMYQGRMDEATKHLTRAFQYGEPALRLSLASDLGIAMLHQGLYADGLALVDPEWGKAGAPQADWPIELWDGEADLAGKTIVVYHHHGLGDTVQFSRFLRWFKGKGANVILAVPQSLVRLLDNSGIADRVVGLDQPMPSADFKYPLSFMLRRVGLKDDTSLSEWSSAYLRTGRKPALPKDPSAFTIGICWSAAQGHTTGPQRSIPLEEFLPLAMIPGVRLFSLQVGPAAAELERLGADFLVRDLAPMTRDFDDLAHWMWELDLVVSADTAPLHVAGALGFSAIGVLSATHADWRWPRRHDGDTNPWYPSLTLVRQPDAGDWAGAFAQVEPLIRERMQHLEK